MAANVTVALGKELGGLKQEYDRLQKHLSAVEKTYHNLISSEKSQDGEVPIATRLELLAAQLFGNDMFSDITILLQGGTQVRAHRFVLAASGNNWGVNEFDKVDMLDLTDMRYEVSYAMIKWVYTDEYDFQQKVNDDFLIELMQAASICKLESLFIRCQKALSSILNKENCEKYLKVSEELNGMILKDNCIKILQGKEASLKPNQVAKVHKPVVKIVIPSPKQRTGTKKTAKRVVKSNETPKNILQGIENSSLQAEPLAKTEAVSPVKPAPSGDSNCLLMVEKQEIESDNADDDGFEDSDAGVEDNTWENLVCQTPDTPAVKREEKLNHQDQQDVAKDQLVDIAIKGTEIPEISTLISGTESTVLKMESSVVEEGQVVNGNDSNPDSETFTCDVCNKSFIHEDYLKKHKVIHDTQADIRKHTNTHAKVLYECNVCGKYLRSASGLEIHKATHEPDSGVQCEICDKYLRNKVILKNHMYIHTGEKKYKCNICNKSFRQGGTLKVHKKIHSGLRPYMCEVCGKSFVDSIHLKRHKSVHINGKTFQCTKCDKSFRQKTSLNRHYSTHDSVYRCEYCTKVLLTAEEYQSHRQTHLAPGQTSDILPLPEKITYTPKPCCCDVCGKTFQNKSLLKTHMSLHTGERPFSCTVCNKTFRTELHYKEHSTLHTGEQPHQCAVCGKTFRLHSTLSAHKNTHNKELSFTCDVCGKGFTTAAYLRKHKTSHRPDKPYKCDLCGLGFRFASTRNVHRRDHEVTAKGGYECPFCGKKGIQSRSWFNAHKKACRETPRFCTECGIYFSRSHTYKQHTEKYGNVSPHYHCSKCLSVFTDLVLLSNHDCVPKISCPYCPTVVVGRLKRHLETCHPDKAETGGIPFTKEETSTTTEKFTCPFCEAQVLSVNNLKRHIRITHKDVEVSKVTRESVSIVPAIGALALPQKTEEITTQEVFDRNTILPESDR